MIKMLFDRVLVLPDEPEEKVGSLYIPNKERNNYGTVKAVGSGVKDKPTTLKEGDRVVYGEYDGIEMELEGVKYLMFFHEDDIVGKL